MDRYYFNVHDGSGRLDDDGIELSNTRAAGIEALRYAGELLKANAEQLLGERSWYMEVTDEQGVLILRIDLSLTGLTPDAFAS